MLFLTSRVLNHDLNDDERLRLLANLEEKGMRPLIRSTRLSCYELAMADFDRASEMEIIIAAAANADGQSPYVKGEIFCFEDHVLFLIFGESAGGLRGTRAGIVYERRTAEPLRKLDSFCEVVSQSLSSNGSEINKSVEDEETRLSAWKQDLSAVHQGFMRFLAKQDLDSVYTFARKESLIERVRASEMLDDNYTRYFLHCVKEASGEGYAVGLSASGMSAPTDFSVNRLLEVGLLNREVMVSCRRTEHTLFSLPSPDALAAITISEARCSECGAKIVDEKIEEVVVPTQLGSELLEDGAWMVNRLQVILRELGVPESEIAVEPPSGEGEARMMVNVCDEPFLLVLRDGDLTPAFARRAVDIKIGTQARHLVVVVTGTIHKDGRRHLLNFAQRMTRRGVSDFELIIGEGVSATGVELERAFERVSQKILAEQLCELDDSLGVSAARLLITRFQLLRKTLGAVQKVQASAATAAAAATQVTALQVNEQAAPLIDLALINVEEENQNGVSAGEGINMSRQAG
ncbi:MAG TPA: hypothetical protein VGB17_02380 [Pyrinomonadaceae bacterium]|jgi:hypothetical protein